MYSQRVASKATRRSTLVLELGKKKFAFVLSCTGTQIQTNTDALRFQMRELQLGLEINTLIKCTTLFLDYQF